MHLRYSTHHVWLLRTGKSCWPPMAGAYHACTCSLALLMVDWASFWIWDVLLLRATILSWATSVCGKGCTSHARIMRTSRPLVAPCASLAHIMSSCCAMRTSCAHHAPITSGCCAMHTPCTHHVWLLRHVAHVMHAPCTLQGLRVWARVSPWAASICGGERTGHAHKAARGRTQRWSL